MPSPWTLTQIAVAAIVAVLPSSATGQPARVRIVVPAQDMAAALKALARDTWRQVAFDRATVAGKRSRGVTGTMTPERAMARLLSGSGLVFTQGPGGLFVVTAAPHTPTLALAQVLRSPAAQEPVADIVVTARKRDERALDVPIALTAVTGETAERRGARNLSDVLQETPGVGIYDLGSGLQKITIRGVSTSLGGNENGYYLDDLPFTGVTVPIAPDARAWDLDRVEVLRGPQGTLFGEGSLGGTVRILTRDADLDAWEAKGVAYVSSTEGGGTNRGIKGAFNAPIITGVLAVRVSGTAETLPGWIDDAATGGLNLNNQGVTTFRARARFDPTDRLTIGGSYWFYDGIFPGGGAMATDEGQQPRSVALSSRTTYRLYGASARYDLGDAEFFYGYSHNKFDLPQSGAFLGGSLDSALGIKMDAHEMRLASNGSEPLQWTVGGYARDATRRDRTVFALFGLNNIDATDSRARAVFGEATYSLPSAPIDITAGLRYYREKLGGFEVNNGVFAPDKGDIYTSWNPRVSVAWHPIADSTIYASAAKGFRAGQLQPTTSSALAAPLGIVLPAALVQDSIWTYEIGSKVELLGRHLMLEIAAYRSDWNNVAVRQPIGTTGFNGLVNSPGTTINGVEISAILRPARGLTLSAGGSYIDATYAGSVAGTGIVRGAAVDDVARASAYASADLAARIAGVSSYARVGWQHSSPRRFVSFPGFLPGDTIDRIDARAGIDSGGLTFALFVDNLTDDGGAVSYRAVQPLVGEADDITAVRLRPRTIGIEIGMRFGQR